MTKISANINDLYKLDELVQIIYLDYCSMRKINKFMYKWFKWDIYKKQIILYEEFFKKSYYLDIKQMYEGPND